MFVSLNYYLTEHLNSSDVSEQSEQQDEEDDVISLSLKQNLFIKLRMMLDWKCNFVSNNVTRVHKFYQLR